MNAIAPLSRRGFLSVSAAAGAFTIGIRAPLAQTRRSASTAAPAGAPPEINAWVVVKPDDTVVIRIARSEMGQGTLTGLAQLVAEELDCDWARSPPNTRPPARTWRATASGATSPPAAAAASANRTNMSARAAPRRG